MLSESDVRMEIDEALKNKGWLLYGNNKNVFAELNTSAGRADYVLRPNSREVPLIIIEAKRKGKDLNLALEQAKRYAYQLKAPIAYASDGSTVKTIHIHTNKPLILNGEEVDYFLSETLALQYLNNHEYNTTAKAIIQSRQELINIFSSANKELRKGGLQAGIERFSEFCNILFLKIFSEEEQVREDEGRVLRIKKEFRWDYFKNKDGEELLSYVNDTVFKHFRTEYGHEIFEPLQLKNPKTLKRIIDKLDPLSLVDTNSDIKGDAFEYFLKAYLAKQSKDLGEYFTPRHIVKTLVKLSNPKFGETIYDPFCGTGGMLIEAFKHIYNKMPMSERNLEFLQKETIWGGEVTKNARITKMNMILVGDGHNNIKKQDSLGITNSKKYDLVITNMPFSLGNFEEHSSKYSLGSANGNSLCIEHCFNAISERSSNPRIAIIVPDGILFDKKYTKLRRFIYNHSHVESIISLPDYAFKPYAEVRASILYLTKVKHVKEEQKHVWFFNVNNDGYTVNSKRAKKDGSNDLDVFLSYNDSSNENDLFQIGFNKLDMETIRNNHYISIVSMYKGFKYDTNFYIEELGNLVEEVNVRNLEDLPVLSVTNNEGFVDPKERFNERVASVNTANYKIVPLNAFAYNPSRINVGSIALNTKMSGCVSPMYVVLKIKNEDILLAEYLFWLLKSDKLKEQIKFYCYGSVRQTLNFDDFCKIKIPLPTKEAQQSIINQIKLEEQKIKQFEEQIKQQKYLVSSHINSIWEKS